MTKSTNLKAQASLELIRRRGLLDFFYFTRDILGYVDLVEIPHKDFCAKIISESAKKLFLYPRGHFKSTIATISYPLFYLLNNPDGRVLIVNATLQNAKAFLREIKTHLVNNFLFRACYGDLTSQLKWTETEIMLASRNKNLKEPSIYVAGVGQSLTGLHFDLIIGDDIVNYDSVNTPEQIAKTKIWWGDAFSLLEPDGKIMLIGTRYHYGDIYGTIIDELKNEYDISVYSAIKDDGTPLFPERFSREKLDEIRREQGSFQFACQYLNNPIDEDNARFKKDNFVFISDLPNKSYFTTMTVDRAYSLAKTADNTGIVIKKQDNEGFWYIVYAERKKINESDLIKLIFDLRDYYSIDKIGIEQNALEYTFLPVLKEEMDRRRVYFTVEPLKHKHSSKIQRIEGLIPRFEAKKIIFVGDSKRFDDLVDECLRFPVAKYDDILDALAYHNSETMIRGVRVKNVRYKITGGDPITGFGARRIPIKDDYFDL